MIHSLSEAVVFVCVMSSSSDIIAEYTASSLYLQTPLFKGWGIIVCQNFELTLKDLRDKKMRKLPCNGVYLSKDSSDFFFLLQSFNSTDSWSPQLSCQWCRGSFLPLTVSLVSAAGSLSCSSLNHTYFSELFTQAVTQELLMFLLELQFAVLCYFSQN